MLYIYGHKSAKYKMIHYESSKQNCCNNNKYTNKTNILQDYLIFKKNNTAMDINMRGKKSAIEGIKS